MAWGVGGWLLTPFLQKIGRPSSGRLRQRVVDELKTTFASHYTKMVSLPEALDPANIAVYGKRATGEKFLINPNKAGDGDGRSTQNTACVLPATGEHSAAIEGGKRRTRSDGEVSMTDLNRRRPVGRRRCRRRGRRAAAIRPYRRPMPQRRAAGAQAPGFYRYKVGSFECTSINDGARTFPMPDKFVDNVPKEEALAAAEAAYMPKGMVTVPFNPQLINTGSKLVLIDSGNGVANLEPSKGAVGRTLQNLAAAGVDPKSIDVVLMSHLHPDHTNGIRAADGSMAFPNAEIMVPAKDWEFWMSDDNAAKAESNAMMKNYFANVRKTFAGIEIKVTKYDWGKEVAPASPRSRRPATRRATPRSRSRRAIRRC